MKRIFQSRSSLQTQQLAASFAGLLRPGDVVSLVGELGAGKTCWVQGMATGLGISEPVTSPTYTLAVPYAGTLRLVHVDAYRIKDACELVELGLDEEVADGAVLAIEWFNRFPGDLPPATWRIELNEMSPTDRSVSIEAVGEKAERALSRLVWRDQGTFEA